MAQGRASSFFTTIAALNAPGLPHPDVANDILRRLAADVEPILNTHKGWRPVPALFEIYPQRNLGPLGAPLPPSMERVRGRLGGYTHPGREICLVLRDEDSPATFMVYAQLLDTFLHELSHQSYGNHGPGFSKLWTTLQQEYLLYKTRGLLGKPCSRGASARVAEWGLDSVSYGVGVRTSGAFRVNMQTGKARFSGALDLAPSMDKKKETKTHFAAMEAIGGGQRLGGAAAPGARRPTKKALAKLVAAAALSRVAAASAAAAAAAAAPPSSPEIK